MSENVILLKKALKSDEGLRKELERQIEDAADISQLQEKFLSFAEEKGYPIEKEDLRIVEKTERPAAEALTDASLEGVAGGFCNPNPVRRPKVRIDVEIHDPVITIDAICTTDW